MTAKTASAKTSQGEVIANGTGAVEAAKEQIKKGEPITIDLPIKNAVKVPKRMTVQEKLDSLHQLEALSSKIEYLRGKKMEVDKFGTGQQGYIGAKMHLEADGCDDVTVSNPAIIKEMIELAKVRLKAFIEEAESEIEAFEIH